MEPIPACEASSGVATVETDHAASSATNNDDVIVICSLHGVMTRVNNIDNMLNAMSINATSHGVIEQKTTSMGQLRDSYKFVMSSSPRQAIALRHCRKNDKCPKTFFSWSSWLMSSLFSCGAISTSIKATMKPIAFVAFSKSTHEYVGSVCIDNASTVGNRASTIGFYGRSPSVYITRLNVVSSHRASGISTALVKHAVNYIRNTTGVQKIFIWATDYWSEQSYQINHGFYTCFTRSTAEHPRLRLMSLDL